MLASIRLSTCHLSTGRPALPTLRPQRTHRRRTGLCAALFHPLSERLPGWLCTALFRVPCTGNSGLVSTGLCTALLVVATSLSTAASAQAATGLTTLSGREDDGPVTVFYPTEARPQALRRGPFTFQLAPDAPPAAGNGRLVVLSHGSGGGPWVHVDLAEALVAAGFTVAVPLHRGDNHQDDSQQGPPSWARRPLEVSRAIDAVAAAPGLAAGLQLDRVGVWGQSAGGHTALSLAGGRWSGARFVQHCEARIAQDFHACVGTLLAHSGGALDAPKRALALWVLRSAYASAQVHAHIDTRVAAVVAANPYAADFDLASLATPRVPLALATTGRDAWLGPAWHGEAVAAACTGCERLAHIPDAGHGAFLSPLPPELHGSLARLLADPPGFDRARWVPELNRRTVAFFQRHLLGVADGHNPAIASAARMSTEAAAAPTAAAGAAGAAAPATARAAPTPPQP